MTKAEDMQMRQIQRGSAPVSWAKSVRVFAVLTLVLSTVMVLTTNPATAQAPDEETLATCALYGNLVAGGGPNAVSLGEELRDLGAPNPPGVEDALDVLSDFNDEVGDTPDNDTVEAAFDVLAQYFDPICADIDVCPLIATVVNREGGEGQRNARYVRGVFAPNPPGIDSALAVLSGDVTLEESGFYTSNAQARKALVDYYSSCTLAFTGATTAPLLAAGTGLILAGVLVLKISRRASHLNGL